MKKGQKPNANEAQLRSAARRGMDRTMVFALTALADKMGFERAQLLDFIGAVAGLAESVRKGYVSYDELHETLVEEKGLRW